MSRSTGLVMKKASDSSASTTVIEADELALLLEAARRANWDAKHGPRHLRSGRFFISANLEAHASNRLMSTPATESEALIAKRKGA